MYAMPERKAFASSGPQPRRLEPTVDNARAMMSASPNLMALARSYEITRKRAPRSVADLPTWTPQAAAFAKQLKSQGYRFVGR